jgi:recombination protein RecR
VRDTGGLLRETVSALEEAAATVCCCRRCGSITSKDRDPCRLCEDPGRDGGALCVVEDPGDILRLEESGGFHGRYHALMGRLSAAKGTGPRELRIAELLARLEPEGVREVVLALNTDVESDATAGYLAEALRSVPVRVTRLAFGLPAGSGIAYTDPVTLARAIRGRQEA